MTSVGGSDLPGAGGQEGDGTIFSYNLATGTESILHSFTGEPNDGGFPMGSFVQSTTNPNILYAMTQGGGTGGGAIINYNIATGAENMLLNSFSVDEFMGPGIGDNLLEVGSTLYGYAAGLYSYNLTSGALTAVHTFTGAPDGISPIGAPVLRRGEQRDRQRRICVQRRERLVQRPKRLQHHERFQRFRRSDPGRLDVVWHGPGRGGE